MIMGRITKNAVKELRHLAGLATKTADASEAEVGHYQDRPSLAVDLAPVVDVVDVLEAFPAFIERRALELHEVAQDLLLRWIEFARIEKQA